MLLAQRKGEWFLVAFAPHIRGCNLSSPTRPRHDSEKFHVRRNSVYVWSHAPLDGVTFYPEIRYRGMRVHPMWWKEDSAEPVLVVQSPTGSEDYPKGVDPWKFVDELVRAGWKWDQREGGTGSVHVDDLEKIEGPPPASAF